MRAARGGVEPRPPDKSSHPVPSHASQHRACAGLTALVDGLLSNETVVNLRLGENALEAKAAAVLARLIKANHTITSLDLRENKIGDEGCAALGEALGVNRGLRCLVLWSNDIGGAGISGLATGLAANSSLQILDMGDNRVDEAVLALKEALLTNSSLHTLGLANAHLGEEGGVTLAEVIEGNRSQVDALIADMKSAGYNVHAIELE